MVKLKFQRRSFLKLAAASVHKCHYFREVSATVVPLLALSFSSLSNRIVVSFIFSLPKSLIGNHWFSPTQGNITD
jgi:hypothetical protein